MEAIRTIQKLSYYILGVLEKTKGVSGALYDLTHIFHSGILDSLVSDRRILSESITLLMQEITLQEPMLEKEIKQNAEKAKSLAQNNASGEAVAVPTPAAVPAPVIKSKTKSKNRTTITGGGSDSLESWGLIK